MTTTRFHDDPCRIIKKNMEIYQYANYYLNPPGNGANPPFILDPQINLQKWGANLSKNSIQIESDLLGYTNKIGKDCLNKEKRDILYCPIMYPTNNICIIEQPRASNPAWLLRGEENKRIGEIYKPLDPIEPVFEHSISTRIYEKDYYIRN
uniref:Uncharacterized protein n=1 Tax=viral metagenome TaxID=1070528 RepID=A0A6C0H725_9ZZZZ